MDGISAGTIAVIFISQRTEDDPAGYAVAAAEMDAAAAAMPGYRGVASARDEAGYGITVSYWRDEAAAAAWRDDPRHGEIRADGRARWYASYAVQVAGVMRAYRWSRPQDDHGGRASGGMTGRDDRASRPLCPATPMGARRSDRQGRRPMAPIGPGGFTVSTLLCGLAGRTSACCRAMRRALSFRRGGRDKKRAGPLRPTRKS